MGTWWSHSTSFYLKFLFFRMKSEEIIYKFSFRINIVILRWFTEVIRIWSSSFLDHILFQIIPFSTSHSSWLHNDCQQYISRATQQERNLLFPNSLSKSLLSDPPPEYWGPITNMIVLRRNIILIDLDLKQVLTFGLGDLVSLIQNI